MRDSKKALDNSNKSLQFPFASAHEQAVHKTQTQVLHRSNIEGVSEEKVSSIVQTKGNNENKGDSLLKGSIKAKGKNLCVLARRELTERGDDKIVEEEYNDDFEAD